MTSQPHPLNLESPSNNTRLSSFSITLPPLLNILPVILGNNLLASLGVVHPRFVVREETVEEDVEDAGGGKGVHIADCETVVDYLSAYENSQASADEPARVAQKFA